MLNFTSKTHFQDSIKGFDCCSLTLQPCKNPVVTPDGWLYDKEAILKYILEKKTEYQKKLNAYEAQKSRELKNLQESSQKDAKMQKDSFEKMEKNICNASTSKVYSFVTPENTFNDRCFQGASSSKGKLPSFWVPSLTPSAEESKLKRPDKTIFCPMSGKPLKMKDLINVKFTEIEDEDDKGKSLIAKEERYRCPVTKDILRNTTGVVVLRPTGHVVTAECVEKIIKKDMIHPLTGEKLSNKDFITLARGGTGYSAANEQLKAERYRPNLAIS